MCSVNKPDRITLDAYSDPSLDYAGNGGQYYRFTNQLTTPILNAKGIQLLSANMVNSVLQLNDQSQLVYYYYSSPSQETINTTGVVSDGTTTSFYITGNVFQVGQVVILTGATPITGPALNGTYTITAVNANGFQASSITAAGTSSGGIVSMTLGSVRTPTDLHCVRLLPSNFVPYNTSFTAYTRNQYFNSGAELVAQLNLAASTGGDDTTYNPLWLVNDITFTYNQNTRKISVASTAGNRFIEPAAADDPYVLDLVNGTGVYLATTKRLKMNTPSNVAQTYAGAPLQPYVPNISMNQRLGWGMMYNNTGVWWNSNSVKGCATSSGQPLTSAIEADTSPILIGAQNVNVYVDIVAGSGVDSMNRKNLAGSVPLKVAPLYINEYTFSGVRQPLVSVPTEIYSISVMLLDETGTPFICPPNYNTELSFGIVY